MAKSPSDSTILHLRTTTNLEQNIEMQKRKVKVTHERLRKDSSSI